jgi:hypothetical protein
LDIIPFRLAPAPLRSGVVEPYPVWDIWFFSRLSLEGTDRIQNFGP